MEPDIEELMLCLSLDPLCVQGTNKKIVEDLNFMEEEGTQNDQGEKVKQGNHNYIYFSY